MQQQRKSRIIPIALLSVAAVAAYIIATPPTASSIATKKPVAKTNLPTGNGADQFTSDDLNAHFPSLGTAPPNVFKPLIYHATAGTASNALNAVPPEDAGGEAGWTFTGIVGIDRSNQASFQNDKTGEFAQVGVGEHWKTCSVSAIGSTTVTLVGPDGAHTIPLPVQIPTTTAPAVASTAPSDNAPLTPPLNGAIGQQTDQASADQATTQVQATGGFGGGFGGGRRRGGGRGGGRRGGGGGFGGGSGG